MADGVVRYRFLSIVGEGGFGKVYRARMEAADGFQKDVAIKVLSELAPPPSLLERFRDEARILGRVRDRAIVGVEPPIRIGERWAVVMDFVDGVSCGAMLKEGRLPPGVAVEIIGEVARALHSAYHQDSEEGPLQLLHRDIKPDNIQVTPSGDVRLLDFGIAKANFADREFKTRHSFGGTPGYIAPERLQRIEVPEGDVFSLGVVLHELVTGARPRFPPTVEFSTRIEGEDELSPFASVHLETADLEVADELRDDPDVMAVLRLAGWMRTYEPEQRPSSRQVEEACRQLRHDLPAPYFRNWAEEKVPHRIELQPDEMVGQVLTTSIGMAVDYEVLGEAGSRTEVVPVPVRPPPTSPIPQPNNHGVVVGAVFGGGLVALLVGGVLMVSSIGLAVAWIAGQEQGGGDSVVVVPDPIPRSPEPLQPIDPAPVPVDRPEVTAPNPKPPAPRPPAPKPPAPKIPVIITVPDPVASDPGGTSAEHPTPKTPTPAPPVPVRRGRTGLVVVRTVPSGATVWKGGQQLSRTGRGYELPIGYHTLELRSTSGERHIFPVDLKADDTVEICYSFDTNAACGAP